MDGRDPFTGSLPLELQDDLRALNPHWQGRPGPKVPEFKRWIFPRMFRSLVSGLTPAVVLRGPRRVGKTILLRQAIEELLGRGTDPRSILCAAFDELESLRGVRDPVLAIARWYENRILGRTFNELAREGKTAYILLDEVQNLDAWAPQVKYLVDNHTVRVIVTGSSSLRIESGRDNLAGRLAESALGYFLGSIPHLDLAHFPPRGLEPEADFVLTIGTKRLPIEVKYRRKMDPHEDTLGLRAFLEKTVYNAPFALLVTMEDGLKIPDPRIITISLSALLWLR